MYTTVDSIHTVLIVTIITVCWKGQNESTSIFFVVFTVQRFQGSRGIIIQS